MPSSPRHDIVDPEVVSVFIVGIGVYVTLLSADMTRKPETTMPIVVNGFTKFSRNWPNYSRSR